MRTKTYKNRYLKGQADHVDAWLMSYADLITLLFMVFVIFVSISLSKQDKGTVAAKNSSEYGDVLPHSGTLSLGTPYDEAYRTLNGIIASHNADQHIAIEKNNAGLYVDISAAHIFQPGSADISVNQLPLLKSIAQILKLQSRGDRSIEVEGHTDDKETVRGKYANNWELTAMRAARIVHLFVNEGVDPARIKASSYAGSRPLVPDIDEEGKPIPDNRNRNQRMVIKLETLPSKKNF